MKDEMDDFPGGEVSRIPLSLAQLRRVMWPSKGEPEETNQSGRLWAIVNDGYVPCNDSVEAVPAGIYAITIRDGIGLTIAPLDMITDELLDLPDTPLRQVVEAVDEFWQMREQYERLSLVWKRGILLHGPPGCGKTSAVRVIASRIVARNGIAIFASDPGVLTLGLRAIRRIEPDRPVVVILEDLDAIVRGGEHALLNLLDGELQIDNVCFVATTNFPEKLGTRLTNRPSRFDLVLGMDMPSDGARRMYLADKNARIAEDAAELDQWVRASKGFSFAHLRELVILVEIFGETIEAAAKRMSEMKDTPKSAAPWIAFPSGNYA